MVLHVDDFTLCMEVFWPPFLFVKYELSDLNGKIMRLAHTFLKSVEVPPDSAPQNHRFGGEVMLFALISFLITQIFSEKEQNVANILKNFL